MYLLAINQALPYGCSFVTNGHPEGSAADDITIYMYIVLITKTNLWQAAKIN